MTSAPNEKIDIQTSPFINIIQLVSTSLTQLTSIEKNYSNTDMNCDNDTVPSFTSMLEWLKENDQIILDEKQQMAYEVICSSFLLRELKSHESTNNDNDEETVDPIGHVESSLNKEVKYEHNDVMNCLHTYWVGHNK